MSDKSRNAFRTISEVAEWLGVQPHVLRFWESKFSQVKPVKRAGGRRYYRPNDMKLLGGIRQLLHEDGLTIKGAQKVLREEGMAYVSGLSQPLDEETIALEQAGADAAPAPEPMIPAPAETPQTGQVLPFEATPQPAPETPTEAAPEIQNDAGETPVAPTLPLDGMPEPVAQADDSVLEDIEDTTDAVAETAPMADDPVVADTPEPDVEDAAPATALPAFLSNPAPVAPEPDPVAPEPDPVAQPSEPEPAPLAAEIETPAPAAAEIETPAPAEETATPLPSFMQSKPEAATPAPEMPEDTAEPASAPVDTAPKPRVVDVPDVDESTLAAEPALLSAVFSGRALPEANLAAITPLVAQLAALRDRMSAEHNG